jgi:hypothetical protein
MHKGYVLLFTSSARTLGTVDASSRSEIATTFEVSHVNRLLPTKSLNVLQPSHHLFPISMATNGTTANGSHAAVILVTGARMRRVCRLALFLKLAQAGLVSLERRCATLSRTSPSAAAMASGLPTRSGSSSPARRAT